MTEIDILALEDSARDLRAYIEKTAQFIERCKEIEDSILVVWQNRLGVRRRIRYLFLLRKARRSAQAYRSMRTEAVIMLERVLSTAARLAKEAA